MNKYPLADILRPLLGDNPMIIMDDDREPYYRNHFLSDPELEYAATTFLTKYFNSKDFYNKIKKLADKNYSEINMGESEPTIHELCYAAQTRIEILESLYESEQSIYR